MNKYSIDSSKVFITGFSMGGYGALNLFLKRPGLFLSCGSTGGLVDLNYSPNRTKRIAELIGDYTTHKARFNKYSPINNLKKIKGKNKHIIFDCGTDDYLYEANNHLRQKCKELKIKATFISQPGNHNMDYWRNSIKTHFDFFEKLCEQQDK